MFVLVSVFEHDLFMGEQKTELQTEGKRMPVRDVVYIFVRTLEDELDLHHCRIELLTGKDALLL